MVLHVVAIQWEMEHKRLVTSCQGTPDLSSAAYAHHHNATGQQQQPLLSLLQAVCSTRVWCSAFVRLSMTQMAMGASLKLHGSATGKSAAWDSATLLPKEQGSMLPATSSHVGLWPFSNLRGGCLSGRAGQCRVSDPLPDS